MNFKNKYKCRKPKETIEIIKSFFIDRGFNFDTSLTRNSFGTYSSRVRLYYKGNFIMNANGKGVTSEFCEASGFAEMYERFCNICPGMSGSRLSNRKAIECNLIDFENLKLLKAEEFLKNPHYKKILKLSEDSEINKKLFDAITDGGSIHEQFINILDDNDKKWFSRELEFKVNGSTGLSAGNSLSEAFVQGFSEILERRAAHSFMRDEQKVYHLIPFEKITNPELRKIISEMKKNKAECYVLDLSYNYNIPVVAILVSEQKTGRLFCTWGCFPVFDIALERCLTETVQGFNFIDEYCGVKALMPYKGLDNLDSAIIGAISSSGSMTTLKEDIFSNFVISDISNIYIKNEEDLSEKTMLDYYKKIIRSNNMNVYYLDTSLCKEMSSIRIILEDPIEKIDTDFVCENFSKTECEMLVQKWKLYDTLLKSIAGKYSPEKFIFAFEELTRDSARESTQTSDSIFNPYFCVLSLFPSKNGLLYVKDFLESLKNRDDRYFNSQMATGMNLKLCRKYWDLFSYLENGLYTKEEIRAFGKVLDFDYSDDDFDNFNNWDYVLEHVMYKPLWELYHSELYAEYVKVSMYKEV